jgi:hypothetical protein
MPHRGEAEDQRDYRQSRSLHGSHRDLLPLRGAHAKAAPGLPKPRCYAARGIAATRDALRNLPIGETTLPYSAGVQKSHAVINVPGARVV